MTDQAEFLRNPKPPMLTQRLQTELDFTPDDTGEWLVNDEFTESSGINGYEWLPTRVRVLSDGSRLEFGVRKEDLEKTLELARLAGDKAQGVDHLRAFWPDDSRITVVEDEEWLFMGSGIEPSAEGFESDYQGIHFGLEVATAGALKSMGYEEMKADKWFRTWVEAAETKREGYRTILFPQEDTAVDGGYESGGGSCSIEDRWDRQAPDLGSFRIDDYKKSITNAPTTLRMGDMVIEGGNGWLIAHNGTDDVTISDSWNEPAEGENRSDWNHYTVKLPITEGIEVTTVSDISKLSRAILEIRYQGTAEPTVTEYPVRITVEDHAVKLESEDGQFAFEVHEPACTGCQAPLWQFRAPTEEEWEQQYDPRARDIVLPTGFSRNEGVYFFTFGEPQNDRKIYCYDDYVDLCEQFAQEHPFARRQNAVAAIRQRLDTEGYSDVALLSEQTWPVWPGQGTGLELFAYIQYERNGRTITRRAGRPQITYDGEITLDDLPSREYIEFR